mmetsp:Transcript_10207/g.16816  ORF Transcript_10207/g.16816 Transcript_10207/m.16816 type:complete len:289 (+) Transcript_10207:131-997(+)
MSLPESNTFCSTKTDSDHRSSMDGGTPISDEIKSQMHQTFVNDQFSADCEGNQKRPFIRTGVKPAIGQRIELTIFLQDHIRRLPFRLSGEVISVGPSPNWHPSSSMEDSGPGRGSMCCADAVRFHETGEQIKNVEPDLAWVGAWERMPLSKKQYYEDYFLKCHGALHGQTMVCEARLNFDYDMRRSSEDGPWIDLIPFDARDVWRFVVTFDDRYEVNMWWADKNSFMNMGRDHRPRCWPWAKGDILPFNRKNSDMPITGHGPNGEISVHISVGPFGPKRTYIYPSRAA